MSTNFASLVTEEIIARQVPEAQAIIRGLLEVIAQQQQRIEQLERRVAELEAEVRQLRGGRTAQNSSLPPSQEHPHHKTTPARTKSNKKQGGQPGHLRHQRALIPTEDCQQVIPCKPTHCRRCDHRLTGRDPMPWRHQVAELPEIRLNVIEYQRHRLVCLHCHTSTCGELPTGVPQSTAGPRLTSFVALLMGCFRQSKSRVVLFLQSLAHFDCSPGWIVKLQNQMTKALQPAYQELVQALPRQPKLGIDESPTKEGKKPAWHWAFVAERFTVLALRLTRGAVVLRELLTDRFTGVLSCDRAKSYWHQGNLQWCWAHLKRHFQGWIDSTQGQVKRLGHDLMRRTRQLFRLWHRVRDGTLTWLGFKRLMSPLRHQVDGLLLRGCFNGNATLQRSCDELHKHRHWLWTFLDHQGVEPTNNASERALRHAVIWRKLSFGTQSATGSRFVEAILTILATCQQQQRDVMTFLTQTLNAYHHHRSCPLLLTKDLPIA